MKKLSLLIFAINCCVVTKAQVQFWNIADVEDAHWIAARKTEKIKRLEVYQTGEDGKRIHDKPGEISEFSTGGLLTMRIFNKYDWASKSWRILNVDSFYYNARNQLTGYRSFSGAYYTPSFETVITYNSKNQQVRQDNFRFSNAVKEADGYTVFEYNAKNQPAKFTVYNPDKTKDFTCTFLYDVKDNLVKNITKSEFGEKTELFTWNNKNQLERYQELYEKELQKTITYLYDETGRRIKKQTVSGSSYEDFTEYTFNGNSKLYSKSYLQYITIRSGKKDSRHEFKEMQYSYYE